MSLLSISLILFLIIDPLGQIAALTTLLEGRPKPLRIIARELLIGLGFMVLFNFIGESLFELLAISETTVMIASGVILFLAALKILFPPAKKTSMALPEGEPFVVPIAIPMISGPALLATIMLFGRLTEKNQLEMLLAIFIAWAVAGAILLASYPLKRILGNSGLIACERLMAMVLVMLAIQRFMDGVNAIFTPTAG